MGQTLTNGIYLPNEGERNCYSGLAANWNAVDTLKGNYSLHAINVDIHVTSAEKETWNGKADASALTAHTGNTTIHVTSADKEAWNGKADNSALTAHTGDTTIHVTAEDKQAWNGHVADTVKHVTAEDKAKWDAVTTKADDSGVVHKSGDETISGAKTFDSNTLIYNSDNTATTPNLYLRSSKIEISSQGNTSGDQNLTYLDKNSATYAYVKGAIQSNGTGVKIRTIAKDSSDNSVISELQLFAYTNGKKAIFPSYSNEVDLGVSNYKWKSFNGLEPSSLSLPSDRSARIDISSYFTNTGDNEDNAYVASANGYIFLDLGNVGSVFCSSLGSNNYTNYKTSNHSGVYGVIQLLFPIIKGNTAKFTWRTNSTVTIYSAYFIPCQGNV